jgi:hypothetical protein
VSARRKASLAALIRRTRLDAFFVSRTLARYQSIRNIGDSELRRFLNCSSDGLERLALCRFPDDREAQFRDHVRQIASYVPCDASRLLELFREVAALDSLQGGDHGEATGLLLAARDRRKQPGEGDGRRRPRKRTKK